MQHLNVVDADHRDVVGTAVEVGPRLEVADHAICLKRAGNLVIGGQIVAKRIGRIGQVGPQRRAPVDARLILNQVQSNDFSDLSARMALEHLFQKAVGPPRHHHVHVVSLLQDVFQDHTRPRGVSHTFADYTVENSHWQTLPGLQYETACSGWDPIPPDRRSA